MFKFSIFFNCFHNVLCIVSVNQIGLQQKKDCPKAVFQSVY